MVSEGDVEGVRDLLVRASSGKTGNSVGTLLDGRNAEGQTALHLVCMRGYAELVETILEYPEADVEVLDKDGDPPIVFALAAGTPNCLKTLIKKGENVNAKIKEGLGPSVAHVCAFHGQPDCMRDMLLGGSDTGPTIMEWAMSEALRNRPVMKKLQDELERVVGMDRMVSESDLAQLVYLPAMVKETLRLHPPASLVERCLYAESCNVMGYEIPHKTHVIINLWAIGRDPKSWEDAEIFKPERFMERVGSELDANGLDQNLAWLPFGAGRRTCPGRQLGTLLVEFGLAQLFHCFNWRLPMDDMNGKNQELDMTERFNGITLPRAHELRAIPTPRLECIGRLK